MPNAINVAINAEYERLFAGNLDGLFVQPLGMTVQEVNALRGRLAAKKLHMQVLRGSLARRVLEARGLSNLGPLFEGPSAVITSVEADGDPAAIVAAKVLAAWRKESGKELPALKGGLLEGEVLVGDQALVLEKMPGKAELLARVAGQIVGPGRRLSGQVVASGGRLAGQIKTHIENLEKQAG